MRPQPQPQPFQRPKSPCDAPKAAAEALNGLSSQLAALADAPDAAGTVADVDNETACVVEAVSAMLAAAGQTRKVHSGSGTYGSRFVIQQHRKDKREASKAGNAAGSRLQLKRKLG